MQLAMLRNMETKTVIVYRTLTDKVPIDIWQESLDAMTRAVIAKRLERMERGNFGDWKPVQGSKNISELRIDYGPGYRIYFAKKGPIIVILLSGGSKKTQTKDIQKAQQYWQDFKERYHGN
jgi:putative addiction module killer protein